MAAAELEPILHFQPRVHYNKKILYKSLIKWKCIAFNFIFSIIILFAIIYAGHVNILSYYNGDDGNYFNCGWNNFEVMYCHQSDPDNSCDPSTQTWSQKYNDCMSSISTSDHCDWYKYPQTSGLVIFYCNIIASISLIISQVCYIGIMSGKICFVSRKTLKLKRMYIITVLFQSFIPALSLVVGMIYWFQTNKENFGCWNNTYRYKINNGTPSILFDDRRMGESMIFDIGAVILLTIHCIIYCQILDKCVWTDICTKRKRRRAKYGEPIFMELENRDNKEDEGEGYSNEYIEDINHVDILSVAPIEPGLSDEMENDVESEDDDEYSSIKKWFDESMCIPNKKCKQEYYDKFIENGFDNFVAIKAMNNQDLIDIGVDKIGHRKTVMIAIQQL